MTVWQLGKSIIEILKTFGRRLRSIETTLSNIQAQQARQEIQLQQILAQLLPPPPAGFLMTFESNQENEMANKAPRKATMDFQLLDNGTATATLTLVDAAGLPTTLPSGATIGVPPWASSNPAIVVTPAADGMSAALAPSSPPVLVTGVVISAGPATITNADGSTVSLAVVSGDPIDVIAGGPAGFSISEQ
jgi:hypothetical protein